MLLVFEMYFFVVCFPQAVTHYKTDNPDTDSEEAEELITSFGTLGAAMYSLYQAMSNGKSWGLVATPLFDLGWVYGALFLVFISITLFGVLNVLTAVFVESAMQSTSHHRDLLVQEKQRQRQMYLKHLKTIFLQVDEDESGYICLTEVEQIFNDPSMSNLLDALDITAFDARSMFKLLDSDDSGSVDIDEFCDGCLRLKGEARSFDINCLMYENARLITKTTTLMGRMEQHVTDLRDFMQNNAQSIDKKLAVLRQGQGDIVNRITRAPHDLVDRLAHSSARQSFFSDAACASNRMSVLSEESAIELIADEKELKTGPRLHGQPIAQPMRREDDHVQLSEIQEDQSTRPCTGGISMNSV